MKNTKVINYISQGNELEVAIACHILGFPLMLRGPTGIGKTTLLSTLSKLVSKPVIPQVCNEDIIASDLIGRNTNHGWIDGTASRSLRYKDGAIYYVDEIGEARQNATTVFHSLSDDRRYLDLTGNPDQTELVAPDGWMFVAAYNPRYQVQDKVKPSLAQRFITVDLDYPNPDIEEQIVDSFLRSYYLEENREYKLKNPKKNTKVPIKELIKLANDYRRMADSSDAFGLREGPSPRLTARTAKLIEYGLPEILSIEVGIINPLTYDADMKKKLFEVAYKIFRRE